MALGPERTKPLHNFDLPCLKWGSQKYLRCLRVVSNGGAGGGGGGESDRRSEVPRFQDSLIDRRRESESGKRKVRVPKPVMIENNDGGDDAGFAAMREKLILELETSARKMKDEMFGEKVAEAEAEAEGGEQSGVVGVESKPWNLRTRRAAAAAAGKSWRIEERKMTTTTTVHKWSPRSEANNGVKLTRLPEVKKERAKFSVALTKKEIEEDFMKLLGHKPPRRPKKRSRIVQKQLDVSQSFRPKLFSGQIFVPFVLDLLKLKFFF